MQLFQWSSDIKRVFTYLYRLDCHTMTSFNKGNLNHDVETTKRSSTGTDYRQNRGKPWWVLTNSGCVDQRALGRLLVQDLDATFCAALHCLPVGYTVLMGREDLHFVLFHVTICCSALPYLYLGLFLLTHTTKRDRSHRFTPPPVGNSKLLRP